MWHQMGANSCWRLGTTTSWLLSHWKLIQLPQELDATLLGQWVDWSHSYKWLGKESIFTAMSTSLFSLFFHFSGPSSVAKKYCLINKQKVIFCIVKACSHKSASLSTLLSTLLWSARGNVSSSNHDDNLLNLPHTDTLLCTTMSILDSISMAT